MYWESQGVPREMGGSVLQTTVNKRQADSGWAEGRGSPGATASPSAGPERKSGWALQTRSQEGMRRLSGFLSTPRGMHTGAEGSSRLHPAPPAMHSQQSRQQGSQPPPHRPHRWDPAGLKGHGLFILPGSRGERGNTALDIWDPWILFIFLAVLMAPPPNKILLERAEEKRPRVLFLAAV